LFSQLGRPLHDRGAAGEDNPGGHEFLITGPDDLLLGQREDLLHPGLDDAAQDLARYLPGLPPPHAGDLDGFVLGNQGGIGAAVFYFQLFRFPGGGSEAGGDVTSHIVAAHREHRGMLDAAL